MHYQLRRRVGTGTSCAATVDNALGAGLLAGGPPERIFFRRNALQMEQLFCPHPLWMLGISCNIPFIGRYALVPVQAVQYGGPLALLQKN